MANYIIEHGTAEQIMTYQRLKGSRSEFKLSHEVEIAINEFIKAAVEACNEHYVLPNPEKIIDGLIEALRIVYAPEKRVNNRHDCVRVLFDVRTMLAYDPDVMTSECALALVGTTPFMLSLNVSPFKAEIARIGGRRIYRQVRHTL
ncbi:MAG: hypothetical protein IJU03_10260 [Thermoguttaceae bacterium]|nr:hypothetical protein [Thermoguttaceae bacterium]